MQNPTIAAADTPDFPHFMLKEIYEQPEVIRRCLAAYLNPDRLPNSGLKSQIASLIPRSLTADLDPGLDAAIAQIQILACGTSRHAGLVAQYWFEQLAGVLTHVRSAAEFVAAPFPVTPNTLTIALSQSGETADTIAALQLDATRRAAQPATCLPWHLSITNNPNSRLAQRSTQTLPTLAGNEIGVAATKTFTSQLLVLACLALNLALQQQTLSDRDHISLLTGLQSLPDHLHLAIDRLQPVIQELAQTLAPVQHCILLGSGVNHAIALEGALKLKETTYIHAEGYAAGEFLHGPIALLDPEIPVVVIAPTVTKALLAIAQTAKTHGSCIIGITTETRPLAVFDRSILLPAIDERLSPFLTVLALQLLAYYTAVARGCEIDRPRNLTKTLT